MTRDERNAIRASLRIGRPSARDETVLALLDALDLAESAPPSPDRERIRKLVVEAVGLGVAVGVNSSASSDAWRDAQTASNAARVSLLAAVDALIAERDEAQEALRPFVSDLLSGQYQPEDFDDDRRFLMAAGVATGAQIKAAVRALRSSQPTKGEG